MLFFKTKTTYFLSPACLNLKLAHICIFYVHCVIDVVSGCNFCVGGAWSPIFMVKLLKMLKLPGRIGVTSSRCPISPSASEQWAIGVSLSVSLHAELLTLTSCPWPTSHKFKFRAWGPPFLSNLFALLICSFPPPPSQHIRRRTQMHSNTKPSSLYSPIMCRSTTLFWKRGIHLKRA